MRILRIDSGGDVHVLLSLEECALLCRALHQAQLLGEVVSAVRQEDAQLLDTMGALFGTAAWGGFVLCGETPPVELEMG